MKSQHAISQIKNRPIVTTHGVINCRRRALVIVIMLVTDAFAQLMYDIDEARIEGRLQGARPRKVNLRVVDDTAGALAHDIDRV